MFKNKAKIKKVLIIAISLALFLIPMFFVSAENPAPAGAGTLGSGVLGVVNAIIGGLCYLAIGVITLFLWITGTVFDWVIGGTTIDASSMNEIVTAGWVIVRDILNILFVLALLGIAFATILRIESYHFKALLPKLLVAALLVNFSKTIALTLVDFSNAIMSGIMGTQNGATASASLLALFNVSSFLDLSLTLGEGLSAWSTEPAVLGTNVAIVGFLGMFTMALAGLAVLLVIRTVVLMILTVFSPVAFVLNVLPVTQKYASKWWEEFTKYLFIGPVVCICYLLALLFAVKFSQGGGIQGLAKGVGQQFQTNVGMSAGTIGQFFGMAISCGIMFVGFTFSKEAAGGLAGAAMNLVKKGLLGAGALAGGFAWRKGNESLASGKNGLLGKGISLGLNKLGVNKDTAEKWGAATRFLSPTAIAAGWKQKQAIRTEQAMAGSAGYIHNMANKITNHLPGMGTDTMDYEERERLGLIDKYRSELRKEGRGSHSYYRNYMREALASGQTERAMAADLELGDDGNVNEAHRDSELGAMVSNVLYDEEGNVRIDKKTRKKIKVPDRKIGVDKNGKAIMGGGHMLNNDFDSWVDRLITTYGKEDGIKMMQLSSEKFKKNGDTGKSEAVIIDEKGKTKINLKHSQHAAGEWAKRSGRQGLDGQRFGFFVERYDNQGNVNDVELDPSFTSLIEQSGIDKDWIKNIGFAQGVTKRMMNQFRGKIYNHLKKSPGLPKAHRDSVIKMVKEAVEQSGGAGKAVHYPGVEMTTDELDAEFEFDNLQLPPPPRP